jgi:hypothetical protein
MAIAGTRKRLVKTGVGAAIAALLVFGGVLAFHLVPPWLAGRRADRSLEQTQRVQAARREAARLSEAQGKARSEQLKRQGLTPELVAQHEAAAARAEKARQLFARQCSSGLSGLFFRRLDRPRTFEFLRLYDDGLVIHSTVQLSENPAGDFPTAPAWFSRRTTRYIFGWGEYYVQGTAIPFHPLSSLGLLRFEGTLTPGKLVLSKTTDWTGRREENLTFVKIPEKPL